MRDLTRNIRNERGGLLGFALVTALVASIAAYAALYEAISGARIGAVFSDRPRARYAAEAGVVIAREQLLRNPAYCGGAVSLDTNADGTLDTPVVITVTTCGPGNVTQPHTISARVTY